MFKKTIKKIDNRLLFNIIQTFLKFIRQTKQKTKTYNKLNKLNSHLKYSRTEYFNKYENNEISSLCEKYGSDKGYLDFEKSTPYSWKPHSYSDIYYDLFNHQKDEIKLVFECGIGSNDDKIDNNMTSSGKPGASLKVWRDYFVNAMIYGADIDKDILFSEERIKTFYVNQLEKKSIENLWDNINLKNFDVIIDDGLHSYDSNLNMFLNSYNMLKKNGIYIIEDVNIEYLDKLAIELKRFDPIIKTTKHQSREWSDLNLNSNLIIIRK